MMSQLKKKIGIGLKADEGPVCDSGIYCYGPLLDAVQMAHIYPDSKTFVDKKLKHSPGKIIKRFDELVKSNNGAQLTVEQIKEFVEANFEEEGLELELWTPEDWTPEPEFIHHLQNKQLRGLAKRINRLWKDLSRRIKDDVKNNPNLYSLIYVPNGFVVPGGRFREFYYWDTYWIVKALLQCDMVTTVKGILENFLLMVSTYGLVPNGGRIYYTKRSQPPFLTLMIREYMNKTAEIEFLRQHLATLEKEVAFWEEKRSINVEKNDQEYRLFVFGTGGTGPRPESYREDVELANMFETDDEKEEFYFHMKAGAETGWDYSTRWMIDAKGNNHGGLREIKTNYIVPVDLNSLMFMNYANLAEFHSLLGDPIMAEKYMAKADEMQAAIKAVLWCEEDRMWYDFDLINNVPRKFFYPSNLFPLWAECYEAADRMKVAESAVKYLKKTGAIFCKGGIPTSLSESGQQWDFPNAWPPLQHILVAGLLKTEHSEARKMALTIARRYTIGTMFSCPDDAEVCNMFEKYNVNQAGSAGGGGEYDVQTGFGWSNGVVFEFIALFGDELLSEQNDNDYENAEFKQEVDLNTQFDLSRGKSKLVRKDSNVFEKHLGENKEEHPCLGIEEDPDEGTVQIPETGDHLLKVVKIGNRRVSCQVQKDHTKRLIAVFEEYSIRLHYEAELKRRELASELNSDEVELARAQSSTRIQDLSDLLVNPKFIDEDAETLEDGEEIKTIAGKSLEDTAKQAQKTNRDLIMHLVNASNNMNSTQDNETISIRISNKDVNAVVEDDNGVEHAVPDLDLQIDIPKSKVYNKNSTVRRRLRHLMSRLTGSTYHLNPDIVVIRDTISVQDSNGKFYDLEMNLKVEVDDEHLVKKATPVTSSNLTSSKTRSRSLGRQFRCPISVPWSKRQRSETRKDSDMDTSSDLSSDDCSYQHYESTYSNHFRDARKRSCSMKTVHLAETPTNGIVDHPDGGGLVKNPPMTLTRRSTSDLFRFTTV